MDIINHGSVGIHETMQAEWMGRGEEKRKKANMYLSSTQLKLPPKRQLHAPLMDPTMLADPKFNIPSLNCPGS